MRRRAVGDRLDEARPLARPRPLDGLTGRRVDREHVCAIHAHAGNAVADRLVGEGLGGRLRRERRRDRPLVVVAEEDEGRPHHGGEVRALVERAFRGGAVAEVDDRARTLTAQLLAPREPGGMRHVGADRDADRGDAPVQRVPPACWMAAPPREDRRGRHPAQQADRRLAVAGEDPVLVVERVHRAGLHRLVVPEDRVRPDAALTVVDERALVVRPQQHHRAVEVEQLLLADAVDLAILVDDAAQVRLALCHLGHRGKPSE